MNRKHNTTVTGRPFTQEIIDLVWEKGITLIRKDPKVYRKDTLGNIIYRPSYGKETEKGWEIDHKNPVVKGGTDNLRNLQPLQSSANAAKGDKYPYN